MLLHKNKIFTSYKTKKYLNVNKVHFMGILFKTNCNDNYH